MICNKKSLGVMEKSKNTYKFGTENDLLWLESYHFPETLSKLLVLTFGFSTKKERRTNWK